jgi:hypothetical protein
LGIRRILFKKLLDFNLQAQVEAVLTRIHSISNLQSPRAISFCIKGLCFITNLKGSYFAAIVKLADNLVSKYRGVRTKVAMVKIIHLW